ncbi:HNH endonuclease [Pseudidiomarina sp.]|uniref:HNH endonuclease n=1 Tax=Pseudidiomarina sp. TaxID=2081707 RepID=UPI003A98517C
MRGKGKLKEKLYEAQHNNSVASGIGSDLLLCPICLQETPFNDATLEHVPPESIGGREILLTCKPCNNRLGAKYDSHVARKIRFDGFGEALFKNGQFHERDVVTLELGESRMLAQIKRDPEEPDRIAFKVIGKNSNPVDVASFRQQTKDYKHGRDEPLKINMTASREASFIHKNVDLSWVKSTYLACCALFGYSYAMSPSLETIRAFLAGQSDQLPICKVIREPVVSDHRFIMHAQDLGLMLVKYEAVSVFLPCHKSSVDRFYESLEELISGARVNSEATFYEWPERFGQGLFWEVK